MTDEQIKKLQEELAFYKEKCERMTRQYNKLMHTFKEFQLHRFGSRSEKYIDPKSPQQLDLFVEEKEQTASKSSEKEEADNVVSIAAHRRKKRKPRGFPAHIHRREAIIPAENKQCSCGQEKTVIRYEITELLNHIREAYEIIEQKREIVVCKNKHCKYSQKSPEIAPNPKRILPKVPITADLLAHIIISKMEDRQPLYHIEKQLESRFGLCCRRNKLARWFINASKQVQPLINLLKETILDYDVASCDPTSIQVLKEPGRAATQKSYAYCMRGGPPQKRVTVYDYNAELHKLFLANWFDGFRGYLHVDAQNIFNDLETTRDLKLVLCNVHARRRFASLVKVTRATDGIAYQALRYYKKVYAIERQAKNEKLTPKSRYQLRQKKTKPLFKEIYEWFEKNYKETLPKSALGEALGYAIKHQIGLMRFLEDGRLEVDNNGTESEIRPWVMARNNFLFADSVDGVYALCNHLTLIRTAKLHQLDPYHYLAEVFRRIPDCTTVEDFEALLPWNISLSDKELLKTA